MYVYNNKDLLNIFRVRSSDTAWKLFPLILVVGVYTGIIIWVEVSYLHLSEQSSIKNIPVMHSLLGFAISMLLVFRTNTAYDRWWEGRKLWGALVNNSRNLAIKLNAMLEPDDDESRLFFRKSIPLFAGTLRRHLQLDSTKYSLDDVDHPELGDIDAHKHLPNQVASKMFNKVNRLYKSGQITGDQLIVLNAELQSFSDICGACERIKNTPIPYSYSAFIKKFIFMYVATLPFGFALSMGYLAIPVVAFIFYVLASLEIVAEEIEDPFGFDDNDLPMQKIADNIKKHVAELI
ncbi:MAG: bestrophin family protein [Sphingobacteriales bacterium JAD_PAG50586_3]|nr:MAG: bestrophin family protein [Sphingobacteriales bacterium JAD_PAG50586_3]